MKKEHFAISQSSLEEAHNTGDREWLATTFSRARQVIEDGGRVHVTQELSGNSVELAAIIVDLEELGRYIKKYSV
ncbi:MAG: hypothetical protein ACYCYR_11355 [Desulfobulbaceae bacterium]